MLNAHVIATIPIHDPAGGLPLGVAVDTINRIYTLVSQGEHKSGYVQIVNGTTNSDAGSIDVEIDPRLAAVDTGLGRLYIANRVSGSVSVIDTATQQVVATKKVGGALFGVAVDPVLHRVYIASAGTGAIVVLDDTPGNPQRPQVIATVPVGDVARPLDTPEPMAAYPYYVAVNPKTHRVYVANFGGDWGHAVSVIDGLTNSLLTTISLADATGMQHPAPHGIAVNPSTNRIYVGCLATTQIVVIDDHSGQASAVVGTIPVPGPCFAVRVDPGVNLVWASCGHQIVLIDGETHATTVTDGSKQPQDIAIDPGSHRAYVVDQGARVMSVLELVDGLA